VFDLDGCIWNGDVLNPGAAEMLAALHQHGRALAFVSNNSRSTGATSASGSIGLGVTVAQHVLTRSRSSAT
jgi:ribonucleotide monophosphatase NagD (HAD superfamily)